MKLHNYTFLFLSVAFSIIISIWAVIFYYNLIDEVYDSLDDGLINSKILIVEKAIKSPEILENKTFDERNYTIRKLGPSENVRRTETFSDTLIQTRNENEREPFRKVQTVFEDPKGNFYELTIITSMVEEDDLIEDLMYSLIWLYGITLFILFLFNFVFGKWIWRAFFKTIEKLRNLRIGTKRELDFPKTSITEFRQLQQTLNEVIASNYDTFQQQKHFISSASHELQTPLAISVNRLELLSESENLDESHIAQLDDVIRTLEKLAKMNRSLLLISQIENNQFQESEIVSIPEVIRETVQALEELIAFRNIRLEFEETEPCHTRMNRELAGIVISNLLRNAIHNNVRNGQIRIRTDVHSLIISNSGLKAALDEHKLFRRFNKNPENAQSIGLGLSIVKTICDLYGIAITYRFDEDMHTFFLQFP